MMWYHYLLIVIIGIIFIVLLTSFICFMMTFYSKKEVLSKEDNFTLPDDEIYESYRDTIISDIKYARSLNGTSVSITSFDGLTLRGKYYEFDKDAPIEILFHGYKGNSERDMSTGVRRVFECKRNALIVDQRASGYSDGRVITFGIKERFDALSWANYVSKNYPNNKIILTGVSMGASTVVMASALNLPKNVIGILADCGFSNPSDIIKSTIKQMKLPVKVFYPFVKMGARIFGRFNLEETSPIEEIKKTKLPIIFIHGNKDKIVPFEMSKLMYENCNSKKELVEINNGAHGITYLQEPVIYVDSLIDFFKDLI